MEKNYTLARAFDQIAGMVRGSGMPDCLFESLHEPVEYVNSVLKTELTVRQAFIISALLSVSTGRMSSEEFASFACVSNLEILDMQSEFDALVRDRLIYCVKNPDARDWMQTFVLPLKFYQNIRYNRLLDDDIFEEWTPDELVQQIDCLLDECDSGDIDYFGLVRCVRDVLENSRHLDLSCKLLNLKPKDAHLVLLLKCIVNLVLTRGKSVMKYQYEDILPVSWQREVSSEFRNRKGPLFELGLLETVDNDYDEFRLTEKARQELLGDFPICDIDLSDPDDDRDDDDDDDEDLGHHPGEKAMLASAYRPKAMFYNDNERVAIEELERILRPDNFSAICTRMTDVGMRPGFVCLFHGAPGTGKTETARQLARLTDREIVQVNLATLRNCYVGESEKNVQQVFDDYRKKLSAGGNAPVLLFNEADGIFGKRNINVRDAVDQMENTLQNIMLQNLETFEGILIATTNLTCNLDKAFERRFLYKIEFFRPSSKVRKSIWLSLIPELSANDADELARRFALSGAQIENVARKHLVSSVLKGASPTMEDLRTLCISEDSYSDEPKPRTSFPKNSGCKTWD